MERTLIQLCRLPGSEANIERVLVAYIKLTARDEALSVAAMKERIHAHRIDEIDFREVKQQKNPGSFCLEKCRGRHEGLQES